MAAVKPVKPWALVSKPKKPILAWSPLRKYLNSIPLSRASAEPGAVSPPNVNMGSSIVTVLEFTVVVAPLTVKLPAIVTLLGNPTVTVPPD